MAATKPLTERREGKLAGGQSSLEFLLLLLLDTLVLGLLYQALTATRAAADSTTPQSGLEAVAQLSLAANDWVAQHRQLQQQLIVLSPLE